MLFSYRPAQKLYANIHYEFPNTLSLSNILNQSTHFYRIQGGNLKKNFLHYYLWKCGLGNYVQASMC